jgi:hypothetical protein
MTKMNGKPLRLERGDDERLPKDLSRTTDAACDAYFKRHGMTYSYGRFGKGRKSK